MDCQRDYEGISLYDYYTSSQEKERKNTTHEGQQVRNTDSGRLVYGGGGITPDMRLDPPTLNKFQSALAYKDAFFNFSKHYLAEHNTIPRDFQADDKVMNEFRNWLTSQKVPFTEGDITENRDYLALGIRQSLVTAIYGKPEGDKVQLLKDPWIASAIAAMPQAKELEDKVKRIVAQRMGSNDE